MMYAAAPALMAIMRMSNRNDHAGSGRGFLRKARLDERHRNSMESTSPTCAARTISGSSSHMPVQVVSWNAQRAMARARMSGRSFLRSKTGTMMTSSGPRSGYRL